MSKTTRVFGNICFTCGLSVVVVMSLVTAATLIWVYTIQN